MSRKLNLQDFLPYLLNRAGLRIGVMFSRDIEDFDVTLPMFIPFVGAYVLIKNQPRDPWHNSLIALAGPAAGSVAAAACWAAAGDSQLLMALAYAGFLLNLINLFPAGWFDGGAVYRAFQLARRTRSGAAVPIGVLYIGLIVLLVAAMWATHVPQHRL